MITREAYGGWANNIKLSNGRVDLIATLDVGPRIIRFGYAGKPNMFKEFAPQMGGTGEAEWMIRGGHRLWHAPEAKPRSYALDNAPVHVEELHELAISLQPAPETDNGIRKEIIVEMDAQTDMVTVVHRLTNVGAWTIDLAPWALTVMDAGGMAIVPLPEKMPHTEVLMPGFPLVLWPYTDLSDARYTWGTQYITFAQDAGKGPGKFGMLNQLGWAAYLVHGTLFVKYFDFDPCAVYPDMGCNFETFSNEEMLEVESLGPMTLLEPGETTEHVETWRLFADVPTVHDEAGLDREIRARAEREL